MKKYDNINLGEIFIQQKTKKPYDYRKEVSL